MFSQFIKFLNFKFYFCGSKRSQCRTFFIVFIIESLIIIPCFFKPISVLASEVVFEMPHSNLVRQVEISQQFVNGMSPIVKIDQNIIKRMAKLSGLFMEGNSLMNLPLFVFSEEVVDNGSNKTTKQKSKGDADNKNGVVDEDIFHFLLSHKLLAHLIAFILGCISGPFWLLLFYRIRGQRRNQPDA